MKTRLTLVSVCILLILAVTYTAFSQGKKKDNNGKKEQQNNPGKEQGKKDKEDKQDQGNGNHKNEGKKDKVGNDDKRDKKEKEDHDSKDNKDRNMATNAFHWNHENFKDREKIRKQEKVTICHKVGRNEQGVTLNVSRNALQAHLNHGDAMGDCPNVPDTRFSKTYLNRRNDYYNALQKSQEQVLYSRSIYEYALERLTNSQNQLILLQKSNAPVAEIQTRQAVVTDLQQNVSLLETLIGVAVNLLVNKLQ